MENPEVAKKPKTGKPTKIFLTCSVLFLIAIFSCFGWFYIFPEIKKNNPIRDNFSSEKYSWFTAVNSSDYRIAYENDAFRFQVYPANYMIWSFPAYRYIGDFHVNVKVENNNQDNEAMLGIMCFYEDGNYFTYLGINGNGEYMIVMKSGKEEQVLASGFNPNIPTGKATYKMSADCDRDMLVLYVNGSQVTYANSDDFVGDRFGLFVRSNGKENSTDVTFDDFSLRF